jgi:hypothetical protein
LIESPEWIALGVLLIALILLICIMGISKKRHTEEDNVVAAELQETEEEKLQRIEKLKEVYEHFDYAAVGLSFRDYVRKVEAGTWGELAN